MKSYGIDPVLIRWIEGFLLYRRQRVTVKGKFSDWRTVLSGIPQGSVLGPLLFVIFINDLPEILKEDGDLYLFADDAKIINHIKSIEDQQKLQQICNSFKEWSDRWLVKLNINKCLVLRLRYGNIHTGVKDCRYTLSECGQVQELLEVRSTRDLGVVVDDKLEFREHITEKIKKAYSTLAIINRNFKYVDKESFITLYKSMVRSHLEYADSVWSPHKVGLIEELEKVQKRATKIFQNCKNKKYMDRLKFLGIPTLVYRRHRGDMIEVYKILHGVHDNVGPQLTRVEGNITRGHSMRLKVNRCRYDIRKYSFSNRIVNVWNSLPEEVVTACSVNAFKNRLDRFWQGQEVVYNYKAKLTGAGMCLM